MKRKLTRREFLKLAGAGAALTTLGGYGVYQESKGEPIIYRNPYAVQSYTQNLDGSVPILIVTSQDAENKFGAYLGEILRAEGMNCFHAVEISSLTTDLMKRYDVVLLAEMPLTVAQIEMLKDFVARGGRLVGMKPAGGGESMFGWEKTGETLSEAYLKVESDHLMSAGINPSTLQFHGAADVYNKADAEVIAWLYTDRDTASENPAIVMNRFGEGVAVAFAFDLAKSIAYMRQGNPERANQDLDGLDGVRTIDMFVGWIDLDRIQIPQADEQQRLFINILALLSKRPLPRLWYFPEDKKSALIVTGDSHRNPVEFIEEVLEIVERHNAHFTVYYAPQIVSDLGRAERWLRFWITDHVPFVRDILENEFGSPTPQMIEDWRARGHEIGLHPYAETGLDEWSLYWKEFTGRGYGPVSQTVRTHRILWTGWMETARVQAMHGMRMNFDYYHVGPSLQKKNGDWVNGHLTGSGRPMKFIDEHGRIIDLYQQLTQVTDEHNIPMNVPEWGGYAGLSAQETVEVSKYLLDRSVKYGDYCAITGQFHIDPYQLGGEPAEKGRIYLEGTLDYANEIGVPILSAQEWLLFTDVRHDTDFSEMTWDSNASTLIFNLLSPISDLSKLTVLLPAYHADSSLASILVDGVTTSASARLVLGGVEYAQIVVTAQEHTFKLTYT